MLNIYEQVELHDCDALKKYSKKIKPHPSLE